MELWKIKEERSGQFTTFDPEKREKVVRIAPGETQTIVDAKGPGIIERMWFTFNGWFHEQWTARAEVDYTILKLLILRIYWDGSETPAVEAPIGDFFGIGHCEYRQYLSKYLGMSSGGFYSYFPMPFEKVQITVENLHDTITADLFFNATYTKMQQLPESCGRFHCQFNTGRRSKTDPVEILNTKGKGHYVGCCVSVQSINRYCFTTLESPEYFFVDGEEKASIIGTGLEDYFNGGWYFRTGEFAGALHGAPLRDFPRSMVSMYRFHENDAIAFSKNLRMAFINPYAGDDIVPYWYSSTAYYYLDGQEENHQPFPSKNELLNLYRIRHIVQKDISEDII